MYKQTFIYARTPSKTIVPCKDTSMRMLVMIKFEPQILTKVSCVFGSLHMSIQDEI